MQDDVNGQQSVRRVEAPDRVTAPDRPPPVSCHQQHDVLTRDVAEAIQLRSGQLQALHVRRELSRRCHFEVQLPGLRERAGQLGERVLEAGYYGLRHGVGHRNRSLPWRSGAFVSSQQRRAGVSEAEEPGYASKLSPLEAGIAPRMRSEWGAIDGDRRGPRVWGRDGRAGQAPWREFPTTSDYP